MTNRRGGRSSSAFLEGVSYRQLRSQRNSLRLNNGEPASEAARKIIWQLLALVLLVFLLLAGLYGRLFLLDRLTDDSYLSLRVSSKYHSPVSLAGLSPSQSQGPEGCAVLKNLSQWAGVPEEIQLPDEGDSDRVIAPDALFQMMQEYLPQCQVEMYKGLSNYEYMTANYENLAKGNAVAVSLFTQETSDSAFYGIVSSVDFSSETLHIVDSSGQDRAFKIDDFISATRLTSYRQDVSSALEMLLNIYSPNTLYVISKSA